MKFLMFLLLAGFSFAGDGCKSCTGCLDSIIAESDGKAVARDAVAVYRCGCSDKTWRQDASKKKACVYCGPSMPDCGKLEKVFPKRGVNYTMDDYQLPNTQCPVSFQPVDKSVSMVYQGKTILFQGSGQKAAFEKDPSRYLHRLPLKPELFVGSMKKEEAGCSDDHSKMEGMKSKTPGLKIHETSGSHAGHQH